MESETIAGDETVVRQALKELTENTLIVPPANNANNSSTFGSGKLAKKIIENDGSGGGDFGNSENLENLNTSSRSCGEGVDDLEKRISFGKAEINSSKEIKSTAGSVLPDIVNVQPNIVLNDNEDDSLVLALTSNLTGLNIATPKGKSPLPLSQLAASNTLAPNHSDALSAVSSDDEVFSECQPFADASSTTMDSKMDAMNQSISWENVISSVTSGCAESIDNTLEQIESATDDLRSEVEVDEARDSSGNATFVEHVTVEDDPISATFVEAATVVENSIESTDANLNPIVPNENVNISGNPEITTTNVEAAENNETANMTATFNSNCLSERSIPEIHIQSATPRPSTSPPIHITPATPRVSTSPQRGDENQSNFYQTDCRLETEMMDANTTFPTHPVQAIHITPATPRASISPQKGDENSPNFNGTFDGTGCQLETTDANTTFPTPSVQADVLNATVEITPNSPSQLPPEILKESHVVAENLNGTFDTAAVTASVDSINSAEDFVSKTKEHKCNENEWKAAQKCNYDEPEAMDVDEEIPTEEQVTSVNPFETTQLLPNSNGAATFQNNSQKQEVFVENFVMDQMDVMFKTPFSAAPQATNKRKSMDCMEPGDDEFSSNGLILNSSDFDFLLSKGSSNETIGRDSLLLKFDPLFCRESVAAVEPQQINLHQQVPIVPGVKTVPHNGTKAASLFQPTLIPVVEKDNSIGSLNEQQHSLSSSCSVADSDLSFSRSANSTIPIGGSYEDVSPVVQPKKHVDSSKNVTETDSNLVSITNSREYQENPKTLKDRINRRQPEEKKGNAKMSVDVIQDMKIETDTKCIDNMNHSQTDEKQDYKMAELEKKIKNETLKNEDVEKKLKDSEQREEALLKRITEKDRTIAKMSGVLEQYEKAIAELIAEKEQIKQNYEKQLDEIKSDRDLNYQHLTSLETTFSDLHAKYERSKQVTATLKANEEALAAEKQRNLENLRLQELRYDKMKNHAMQQLEIANNKLETLSKTHSVEITKLKALLKKEEISRASVNEQLVQKTRENEELVKICDELINGQGTS